MLGRMQNDVMREREQYRQPGPEPGWVGRDSLLDDQSPRSASPDQEIANVVLAAASRFIGRAVSKRGAANLRGTDHPDPRCQVGAG